MENNKKKGFNWRGLATFLLILGMLVEIISGVILYITPPGRFANWNNWTLWGLNKGEWVAIHTIFGYLLLLIIIMHLYFNWRVIVHFFWSKLQSSFNLKREFAISAIITIFIFVGTLLYLPPFSTIMNLGIEAKLSWEKDSDQTSTRGGGSWALSSHGTGDIAPQRGLGMAYAASRDDNSISRQYWNTGNPSQWRGNGRWARNQNPSRNFSPSYGNRSQNPQETSENLKGRDFARLGKMTTLSGTLIQMGEEWGLKTGDRECEIHLGPSDFRSSQGFTLTDGAEATVTGFVYGNDISVATISSQGKKIVLRDKTGRPAWPGTRFSRGGNQ